MARPPESSPTPPQPPTEGNQAPHIEELRRQALKPWLLDPDISRALEDDPHQLYRLLQRKRKTLPLADRAQLDEVLANRRLFSKPSPKAPSMYTINGIGTMLYGKSDRDPSDGTYFATLFFTLVFLPIWPIAQYLVLPSPGGGWFFIAKAPLSRAMQFWRFGVAGACLAAVLALAGVSGYESQYTTVRVVNGFDSALMVSVGDHKPVKAPANRVIRVTRVHQGKHRVVAKTTEGRTLEEADLDVPAWKDAVVYNILGAGPVYVRPVTYYADGKSPPAHDEEEAGFEHFCGKRFITRRTVRWVFAAPPERITMSSSSSAKETYWHMGLDDGGWRQTLQVLGREEKFVEAAAIATAAARLQPSDELIVATAAHYLRVAKNETTVVAWLEELLAEAPQSLAAHRTYQEYLQRTGRLADGQARYRKLFADHPGSAMYGYLQARLEPSTEAAAICAMLIEKHPDDPYLRRGYGWSLFQLRRFAEAVVQYEQLAELDPVAHRHLLSQHARSLIASGRALDAANLVLQRCEIAAKNKNLDGDLAILCAQTGRLSPDQAVTHTFEHHLKALVPDEEPSSETRLWYLSKMTPELVDYATLGTVTNQLILAVAMVERDAPVAPQKALETMASQLKNYPSALAPTTRLLLAGAAAHNRDAETVAKLLAELPGVNRPQEIEAFLISGTDSPSLADMDLEIRAALAFHEGERRRAQGQSPDEAYQQALKDDILQGQITRAVRHAQRRTVMPAR